VARCEQDFIAAIRNTGSGPGTAILQSLHIGAACAVTMEGRMYCFQVVELSQRMPSAD
jgi:hypothetical protein